MSSDIKYVDYSDTVEKFVRKVIDGGVASLRKHYRASSDYKNPDASYIAFNKNRKRNRYCQVYCQDQHRIKLKQNAYIHANFVPSFHRTRRWVATQGPKISTMEDFYAMVVQENVENIVMLCKCYENGINKSAQYYPQTAGKVIKQGGVRVTTMDVHQITNDETTVTKLGLKFKNPDGLQNRIVNHYQITSWPDQAVPEKFETILDVINKVRSSRQPIVVHCSAGIGRTGSMVAIMLIMDQLEAGMEINPEELIPTLRTYRFGAIQNEIQFLFVFRALLFKFMECDSKTVFANELKKKYETFKLDYNSVYSLLDDE